MGTCNGILLSANWKQGTAFPWGFFPFLSCMTMGLSSIDIDCLASRFIHYSSMPDWGWSFETSYGKKRDSFERELIQWANDNRSLTHPTREKYTQKYDLIKSMELITWNLIHFNVLPISYLCINAKGGDLNSSILKIYEYRTSTLFCH